MEPIILDVIKAVLPFLIGYIVAAYKAKHAKIEKERLELEKILMALSEGVKGLIEDRIMQAYNFYVEREHPCSHASKKVITNMFNSYTTLGGDGTLPNNYHKIMDLQETTYDVPTTPPGTSIAGKKVRPVAKV